MEKPLFEGKHTPVERIKKESNGLRGTLLESIANPLTGQVTEDDVQVIKFHGMYQQDDRDKREERAKKKLENLYSFMIRLRLPGGILTPEQWLATDEIAEKYSTKVIKITTRQTIQLHGILKSKIKPTIQAFNLAKLDSICTCGDVNRNVTCNALPSQSLVHDEVHKMTDTISQLLLPKTRAYYEIWLGEDKIYDKSEEIDPLYEDRYLPRKFKIGIAIPPNNDVDVLTNDIGLIAIAEGDKLIGYNIAVGGGLSFTHGNPETYPRLATVIGFTDSEEKTLKTIYEILTIQRDYGNRTDRKRARLKYTVDKMGIPAFKKELEKRIGFELLPEKPFEFIQRKDDYGWDSSPTLSNPENKWHYTAFVECGRITDDKNALTKTALNEIAKTGKANIRFTCNQNVIISDVQSQNKELINSILEKHKVIEWTEKSSALRLNSMACVAFNTCPLALAEAQRYIPELITKIEPILQKYGLEKDDIIMRMTGCPNGCGRSTASEIGFIGTAFGKYNLNIGGDRLGLRLNKLYKENIDENEILSTLDDLFKTYAQNKKINETFGDFTFEKVLK